MASNMMTELTSNSLALIINVKYVIKKIFPLLKKTCSNVLIDGTASKK